MDSQRAFLSVEEHESISPSDFRQGYEARKQPLIVRGCVRDWPAVTAWQDPETVATRLAKHKLKVEAYSDDAYRWDDRQLIEVDTRTFLQKLWSNNSCRYYLADVSIMTGPGGNIPDYPGLAQDIRIPDLVDPQRLRAAGLFLGSDSTSQCHYHPVSEAIICQVVGRKTLYMFPEGATTALAPFPWHSKHMNWSQLEFRAGALPAELSGVPVYRVDLEAGDALFIPINWWHSAHGRDLSASVTFFWNASPQHVLRNHLLPRALRYFVRDQSWLRWVRSG